jgi:Ca-activated chloride channel family protein
MKLIKVLWLVLFFSMGGKMLTAQTVNKQIFKGNEEYKRKNYAQAEKQYKQAFEVKKNREAQYNLGNAQYQQKNLGGAQKQFSEVAGLSKDVKLQAQANYNLGNTFLAQQKYDEAIQSFKRSLKGDPTNENARYNLAYAQKMKKEKDKQDQEEQSENEKDKDKKDNEQDKQNKKEQENQSGKENEKQSEQEKKDADKNKGGEGKQEGEEKPKSMPSKLSKAQADQFLNALNNEEKRLKEKKEKGSGVAIPLEKDW